MPRRIFVTGHRGMVGSAVCRRLAAESEVELLTASRDALDLTDSQAVLEYFQSEKPDAVIFAAARVGGIVANDTYPVEFLSDNVQMATAAIEAAKAAEVERFLFLGSTCIYPRDAAQPLREEALLSGPLEQTNEAYALAKIVGLKLCQYMRKQYGLMYHSAMPTNLYGPGDNYHPEHSHVLPALIRRFHEAKEAGLEEVVIWGSGRPRREFLHVDDLADALVYLLQVPDPPDWVNVGTGQDATILEVARAVAEVVGYEGQIETDPTRPDGTPRKVTDVSRLHELGWHHTIDFRDGLASTYQHYLAERESDRLRAV
uniref:GDP-L-fucose synthase family protein n=1 Tax=Candidatus Laterigemmans baculatus TaxID=2770505 RepID=UPI0013DB88A5